MKTKISSLLETTVRRHFRFIAQKQTWDKLVFSALINEEETLQAAVEEVKNNWPHFFPILFLSLIEKGVDANNLRACDPAQVLISLAGVNFIYFISRPLAKILLGLEGENEEAFLKAREKRIVDLIMFGLCSPKEKEIEKNFDSDPKGLRKGKREIHELRRDANLGRKKK